MTQGFAGSGARMLWLWAAVAGLLNLGWEIAQLPLYKIYSEGDLPQIAFAVAHCTGGDILIAVACYLISAALVRHLAWPLRRPASGVGISIAAGMTYTVFSEWLNVSVRGSWTYAAAMPQIFGIGLSPLLQWFFVPVLTVYLTRALAPGKKAV